MLYCTPKLQKELGLEVPLLESVQEEARNNDLPLGDWYAELFWCERRKCVIFVSELTYVSFVVLDVFRSEMRPLEAFFRRYLLWYLRHQGISQILREDIFDEYAGVEMCAAVDSGMIDVVEELIFHARFLIGHGNGGLRDVDSMEISRRLSDVPILSLDVLFPWRAARIALGLESPEHSATEVTSHHPLARRIGSPILTVINGGAG
jgi:hypothetical protein